MNTIAMAPGTTSERQSGRHPGFMTAVVEKSKVGNGHISVASEALMLSKAGEAILNEFKWPCSWLKDRSSTVTKGRKTAHSSSTFCPPVLSAL